ncbi:MAG: YccF domain-containing protein [Nocardioides sp.]|nr:YccF domain-containing protein [Nocardioides sp.]
MNVVLNIIWLVFCGVWMAIGYVVAGVVACILIITIPFGIASFRIARYALWPFGRTVVRKPTAGVMSAIGNVVWIIVAGIWLAIEHAVTGALLCLTIIGIPLGIASFKMIPISLTPLGREIVPAS